MNINIHYNKATVKDRLIYNFIIEYFWWSHYNQFNSQREPYGMNYINDVEKILLKHPNNLIMRRHLRKVTLKLI